MSTDLQNILPIAQLNRRKTIGSGALALGVLLLQVRRKSFSGGNDARAVTTRRQIEKAVP